MSPTPQAAAGSVRDSRQLTKTSCLRRCLCRCRRCCRPSNCRGSGRESGLWDGRRQPSPSPRAKPLHHLTSDSWDNADAGYHSANSRDDTSPGQDTGSCHRGEGDRQLGDAGTPSIPPSLGGWEAELPRWGDGRWMCPQRVAHHISLLLSLLPPVLQLLGKDMGSR